jgi:hypothetical protein
VDDRYYAITDEQWAEWADPAGGPSDDPADDEPEVEPAADALSTQWVCPRGDSMASTHSVGAAGMAFAEAVA